jgi:hypothetical protein
MDEARQSLQQAPSTSQAQRQVMGRAVMVLAQQAAIKATRRELHARSLKPQYMFPREIAAMADDYLAKHRAELIAEAVAIVDRWQAEGVFGPRGAIRNPLRRAS